jgi:pimeloyl-ACP methyl ester carboxylesterase
MANLLDRASDRFTVGLTTAFGGLEENCRLRVAVWGKGPAVYLLHGWGGRGAQWVSFIEPLVSAGFTAVALDAPMHGESSAQRTSILHFAAALSAVVESVGPARLVVGHSLGAAACALALQDDPLSPWGTPEGVGNTRRGGLDPGGVALIGAPADPAEFFGSFLRRLGIGERLHQSIRADVEHRYGFRWTDLAVRPPQRAPQIPALIVHDRDDPEVVYEDAERIARTWPTSTLVATNGLGHQRILRDDRVVRGVVEFALDPGSRA